MAEPGAVPSNAALFARACAVIPGGVNSPVRAFRAVGGTPYFVAKAEGPHVWDAEGTRYLDLVQSYGAIILGHAHPVVIDAVLSAAADGTSFGAPTEREVVLAEAIVDAVPGIEQVRLVSSGTEATMSAIRLARGVTGRSRIVTFAGCYHGHADALLVAGGSGMATLGIPGSAGVTPGAVADTIVAPYGVVPELDDRVAAVIVEPVAANNGLVVPPGGFLEGLRAACDAVGALLIFDEVITGFRLGRSGAQGVFGVVPDLTCLGKVIGGGLPIGAFGGRTELMEHLAPVGDVYQAGTLSGNPVATAAGIAALSQLSDGLYERLTRTVAGFASELEARLRAGGLDARVPRLGTLCGVDLNRPSAEPGSGGRPERDEHAYGVLFHALLRRGVAIAPGAYEVLFVGAAHSDAVLEQVLDAAAAAAVEAAGEIDRARGT